MVFQIASLSLSSYNPDVVGEGLVDRDCRPGQSHRSNLVERFNKKG